MKEAAREPALVFDWRHRSRSGSRLALLLIGAVGVHLAALFCVNVRLPEPERRVALPAKVSLLGALPPNQLEYRPEFFPLQLEIPAGLLELPPAELTSRYVPSYEGHRVRLGDWPESANPAAWPDISGMSQPVLPRP